VRLTALELSSLFPISLVMAVHRAAGKRLPAALPIKGSATRARQAVEETMASMVQQSAAKNKVQGVAKSSRLLASAREHWRLWGWRDSQRPGPVV